jgi:hypothetical protein
MKRGAIRRHYSLIRARGEARGFTTSEERPTVTVWLFASGAKREDSR